MELHYDHSVRSFDHISLWFSQFQLQYSIRYCMLLTINQHTEGHKPHQQRKELDEFEIERELRIYHKFDLEEEEELRDQSENSKE